MRLGSKAEPINWLSVSILLVHHPWARCPALSSSGFAGKLKPCLVVSQHAASLVVWFSSYSIHANTPHMLYGTTPHRIHHHLATMQDAMPLLGLLEMMHERLTEWIDAFIADMEGEAAPSAPQGQGKSPKTSPAAALHPPGGSLPPPQVAKSALVVFILLASGHLTTRVQQLGSEAQG